jgi:hypothetical protein
MITGNIENLDTLDAAALLHGMMETAKSIRSQHKYSEDEAMMPVCLIVGQGEVMVVATAWKNEDEKWAMMKAVSNVARLHKARIVGLATDTRWIKSDKLCSYYNVPPPEKQNIEDFKKWYMGMLRSVGGSVKGFPREVWSEAVMVAAKGPEIGTVVKLANYTEGPNDTVLFQADIIDDPSRTYEHDLRLLPEWWTQ